MNFGKTVCELRKAKNVTQEEMAAELGVTAAAVSKWENNYTLPDILMLCALADYFNVTTDELLGRVREWKYAVIAANSEELGHKIEEMAKQYGVHTTYITQDLSSAVEKVKEDSRIAYLLVGHLGDFVQEDMDTPEGVRTIISVGSTLQEVVYGFDLLPLK